MRRVHIFIKRTQTLAVATLLVFSQLAFAAATLVQPQKVEAAPVCVNDTAGANDEPGQKDLTRLCIDYAGVPTTVATTWNWDETGTSGNNSMDACNLFDTDGDGNINFAVCVTTKNDPATFDTLTTYSCGDDKIDRCTSPATVVSNGTTSCNVSQQNTDPFPSGADFPVDTQGACTVQLAAVGGASAKLIDVCSYPSQQPNSDPSDCVIIRDSSGKVEVIKDLIPAQNSGLFNLSVNGPEANDTTTVNNVGDGGTTGEVVVKDGTVVVSETAGTNTALSSYTTSIVCRDLNGTGSIVAQSSPTGASSRQISFSLADQADVVCVITNTASGSITIIKNALPDSTQNFNFVSDLPGQTNFTLDDESGADTDGVPESITVNNLTAGTYSVGEVVPGGWDLSAASCTDQSTPDSINLSAGENVTCTFTNTKRGQLIVQKTTLPAGDPTQFAINVTGTGTITGGGAGTITDATDEDYEVTPGTYSVAETVPNGWEKTGDTCQDVQVAPGQTATCTITNTKNANLTIVKNALPGETADVFSFLLSGGNENEDFDLDDNTTTVLPDSQTFSLAPDDYQVAETVPDGWELTGLVCSGTNAYSQPVGTTRLDVSLTAGQEVTCTFTNTKYGSISGVKFEVNADGSFVGTLEGWTINLLLDGAFYNSTTTSVGGSYSFIDLLPGSYSVEEVNQTGYTQIYPGTNNIDVELDAGENSTDNNFGNFENGSLGGFKFEDKDGDGNYEPNDGETKLADWPFFFYVDANKDGQFNEAPTPFTTDANGNFSFSDLAPGNYQVCEDPQTAQGWVRTSPASSNCRTILINLSGQNISDLIFGNQGRGNIQVVKNVDENGDGDLDDNEDMLGATDWTWDIDGNGNFATGSSQNVATGTYTVSEDQKDNYHVTDLTCGRQSYGAVESGEVSVATGQTVICTFTNTRDTGTITVRKVVNPTTDNGLFDLNVNGTTYADDIGHGQGTGTLTLPTGANYVVSEAAGTNTDLSDYSSTLVCTKNGQEIFNQNATSNVNDPIELETGDDVACVFTNVRLGHIIVEKQTLPNASTQSFGFTASYDASGFNLTDGQSNNSGNLLPGDYTVSENSLTGWDLTDVDCSDDSNANDNSVQISLAAGETVTCVFTNTQRGSITGTKYEVNADASDGTDATPLANWTIFIDENDNEQLDGAEISTTTAVNGSYTFGNLEPGTYTVCEVVTEGWTQIFPSPCFEIEVDPGETDANNDFGNFQNGSITGYKFNDHNGNNQEDDGDEHLEGWEITLFDSQDNVLDVTTTDAQGNYSFTNLQPATYVVCETQQSGWEQTFPEDCHEIEINVSGEQAVAVFGNQGRSRITVLKNVDENGDGDTTDDEDQIDTEDWTWDLNGNLAADENISTGDSREVPSGSYTVHEDQQVNYEFVSVQCFTRQIRLVVDQLEQLPAVNLKDIAQGEEIDETFDIELNPGDDIVCVYTNKRLPVVLELTKSNDTPEPTEVGATVTYTLNVSVPTTFEESNVGTAFDVTVTDLPPENFAYVPGSATASQGSLTETYASPGVWTLGNILPGQTIVLTYKAIIREIVSPGTYPDLAYAQGQNAPVGGSNVFSNVHLAAATDPFVATLVTVFEEGEVLGRTVFADTGTRLLAMQFVLPVLVILSVAALDRRQKKGGRA